MKRLIISVIFISMALSVMSQSKAIMEFHERFKDNGKYVAIKIDGGILKFLSNVNTEDEESKEVLKALSKLEMIDIHVADRNMEGFDEDYIRDFKKMIRKENFDELMNVREGNTRVDFLIKEKRGKISDLLLIVDEINEFVILSFSGEIDLAALARVTNELDFKGAEHLGKMKKKQENP